MRVEAHLHFPRFKKGQQDCISVREIPTLNGVEYYGTVALTDVTFAVQPAGLARYRKLGQKNVHAFVRGTVVGTNGVQEQPKKRGMREAYYNPSCTDTFVDRQSGKPLYKARAAYMVGNKVYYIPSED